MDSSRVRLSNTTQWTPILAGLKLRSLRRQGNSFRADELGHGLLHDRA